MTSAADGFSSETLTLHDVDPAGEGGAARAFAVGGFADRYERGDELGAGGMGEVRAWRDRATGREVAMKTIRGGGGSGGGAFAEAAARRFAREARVQAQLEHPSIVPVYDVGVDPDGSLYFTMKRIRGHSLQRVLRDGGYSQRKLLTVIARVAMTLEYAHRRGVINRDLKPANIMLGAFDEVYVIDWGLAQVGDAPPLSLPMAAASGAIGVFAAPTDPLVDSSQRPETGAGQLLGTPGYIAPEQVQSPEHVDHRADIYALGAILFEVLAGAKLFDFETSAAVLIATLETDGASPAARAPDRAIPPELDALTRAATRLDPAARPPTAAEVAAAIEAYLDGDRDLERRREVAAGAAETAARALASARAPGAAEPELRAAAARDVGRALAFDPDNVTARATLVQLLTEPAREVPPAAEAAYQADAVEAFRSSARTATLALLSYAAYLPLVFWMGVREPWLLAGTVASIAGVVALTYSYYRRPPATLALPWQHVALSTLAFVFGSSLFGPLVLLPALIIINGVAYVATFDRRAIYCLVPALAVIFGPLALQLAGVLPPSYELDGSSLRILPGMTFLPPLPTLVLMMVSNGIVVAGSILYVWRLRASHRAVERKLALQAWQLAQLVPDVARVPA